jgi:hypothetical protein
VRAPTPGSRTGDRFLRNTSSPDGAWGGGVEDLGTAPDAQAFVSSSPVGRGGEVMAESPGAKAKVTFQDIEVTATKDRLWHVEAAGRSASAEFLDQAIDLVLPRLSYEEQDRLVIRLLMAKEAESGSLSC